MHQSGPESGRLPDSESERSGRSFPLPLICNFDSIGLWHVGPDFRSVLNSTGLCVVPATALPISQSSLWQGFDETIRAAGIRVKKNSVLAPNLQAHVERFVQSIQHEALDHFIVFGEEHFDYLVSQYVEHYHTERPHQAMGNLPLTGEWPEQEGDPPAPDSLVCRTRLGGLLKHYERSAA